MNTIFFDTETTGLNATEGDKICQLSYLITDENFNIINSKNFYFTVDEVGAEATWVHGLTKDKLMELSNNRRFEDFADEIYKDFNESKLVCHNVEFDLTFLKEEFKQVGKVLSYARTFCTMVNYTDILEIPHHYYGFKFPRLDEVVSFLHINNSEIEKFTEEIFKTSDTWYHDARFDVVSTYLIFKDFVYSVNKESLRTYIDYMKSLNFALKCNMEHAGIMKLINENKSVYECDRNEINKLYEVSQDLFNIFSEDILEKANYCNSGSHIEYLIGSYNEFIKCNKMPEPLVLEPYTEGDEIPF